MASKDPKMSKQGTAGKRKHVTLLIPQKLQIIARFESGKSQKEVMASYKSGMSTTHDKQKWKEKLRSFMGSNEGGRTFSTLKETKFVQMDKVLSKQVHSQTTNMVGTEASSMGAHTYITNIYIHNALQWVILCMHKCKKHLYQDHKINTSIR